MTPKTPHQVLAESVQRARKLAELTSINRTRKLLAKAQRDLDTRIAGALGRGIEETAFDVVRMRSTLAQLRHVTEHLKHGLKGVILDTVAPASTNAAETTLAYLRSAQELYSAAVQPIPLENAALTQQVHAGTQATVLRRILTDPEHPASPGVLDRYGSAVVGRFEEELSAAVASGASYNEVRERIKSSSPFLKQAPAYWAERVARTETMAANNAANLQSINVASNIFDDMVKVLSCADDSRTGADSLDVHGQIRRPNEPFDTWNSSVMAPPDRPNDRAVVVPHRLSWPLPANLRPYPRSRVLARWREEGRKGSPPSRPLVSTVKLPKVDDDD